MFVLSLIIAFLMILTAAIPFSVRPRGICAALCVLWVLAWGFVHLVNGHMRFVPAVGALYLFLMAAFPVARSMKHRWIGFQSLALVCTVVAYGIAMYGYIPAYRDHQELRSQYPAVDLKPRLADEQPLPDMPGSTSDGSKVVDAVRAVPKYDARSLADLDEAFRVYLDISTFRTELQRKDRRLVFQALAQVHEGFVADFIAQPGVGRTRLPGVKLLRQSSFVDEVDGVRLDVLSELIDQPDSRDSTSLSAADLDIPDQPPIAGSRHAETVSGSVPSMPDRHELQGLHHHNITNFVPLYSLGGVDNQLIARGFEAHAFHLPPMQSDGVHRPEGWRLSRLELISLLKHRPPAVYVSDHLPAMEELRKAPTRKVTPFESDSINRLVNGEDLVAEFSRTGELTMVGSIRAIADCRECHRVPVGGLLGAFSYKLKPHTVPASADQDRENPPSSITAPTSDAGPSARPLSTR